MFRFSTSVGGLALQSVLAAVVLAMPVVAQADSLVLNDVKAQNGVQLTADELKQLMPNAKVVSYYVEGGTSIRRWKNEPNGKFVASSDVGRSVTAKAGGATGQGTWHVADNGTYCVTIDWSRRSENWCRFIFKVGEKYYGVKSINDGTTVAHLLEFSK